jgi:hypothetical protein
MLTVTTVEDVSVSVSVLVESHSVEVWVEFLQGKDSEDVPMGSAVWIVVPTVPVNAGRERVVWFQLMGVDMFPGAVRAVEVGKPWVHGRPVAVVFNQGPRLLWLLIGKPETLETPETDEQPV